MLEASAEALAPAGRLLVEEETPDEGTPTGDDGLAGDVDIAYSEATPYAFRSL